MMKAKLIGLVVLLVGVTLGADPQGFVTGEKRLIVGEVPAHVVGTFRPYTLPGFIDEGDGLVEYRRGHGMAVWCPKAFFEAPDAASKRKQAELRRVMALPFLPIGTCSVGYVGNEQGAAQLRRLGMAFDVFTPTNIWGIAQRQVTVLGPGAAALFAKPQQRETLKRHLVLHTLVVLPGADLDLLPYGLKYGKGKAAEPSIPTLPVFRGIGADFRAVCATTNELPVVEGRPGWSFATEPATFAHVKHGDVSMILLGIGPDESPASDAVTRLWCTLFANLNVETCEPDRTTPLLVCNEDNDRYFYAKSDDAFTEKGLVDYFDSISSGGALTHYFMCVNGQRTSYDSKVWEPIWKGVDEPNSGGKTNDAWCVNARRLHDRGLDPYAIWIRRAREKGVSPWISLRMNDTHFADRNPCFRNESRFYAHPELKCRPDRTDWGSMAWNYACPDVQEHMPALVAEVLERWDADGLELDWLRFPTHLPPGRERELSHHLTDFMRKVRQLVDRSAGQRGHPIQICVRIPTRCETALAHGLDPEGWAAQGLIDWAVACNFYSPADYGWDYPTIRDRLKTARPSLVVLPGVCNMFKAYPKAPGFSLDKDLAFLRGWAALYGVQAPGLYLFNGFYFDGKTQKEILGGALGQDRVAAGVRRFPVSWHDVSSGDADAEIQLPRAMAVDLEFRVQAVRSARDASAHVVMGFDVRPRKSPEIRLNGQAPRGISRVQNLFLPSDVAYAVEAEFPISALVNGWNKVSVAGASQEWAQVVWCEIVLGHGDKIEN